MEHLKTGINNQEAVNLSDSHHPDFTAFGAIAGTFRVMRDEFIFFATLIILYVIASIAPYLYISDGVDFTDPSVLIEQMQSGQPYFLALSFAYYFLYAVFIIYILDRTNASLNNYSLDDYPYIKRAAMSAIPIVLLYIISMILTGIGFILLIVPGFIVFSGLYLAIPTKLAENINFISAIPRSWELTKGHRLGIWGVLLIPLIPIILIILLFGLYMLMSEMQTTGNINTLMSPTLLTVNSVVNGIFVAFYVTASGVVYHQIRNENMDEVPVFD